MALVAARSGTIVCFWFVGDDERRVSVRSRRRAKSWAARLLGVLEARLRSADRLEPKSG